jgi:ADP-heptose:LPS heptosyltransferase
MSLRNWGEKKWKTLINLFERSGKFTVFILGKGPSYVRANNDYSNLFNVEDYIDYENDITDIGLCIEAIRASRMVIGVQSGAILLSNLLGTKTLMWGHEPKRHSVDENIKKTKCIAIDDPEYSSDPIEIYKMILKELL